jgi:anion-transporting  ArsA/GET3 family ATPase
MDSVEVCTQVALPVVYAYNRQATGMGVLLGLLDKRFHIVAGKGGVGRSSVAAAIGLVAARQGLKTLFVEMHTDGSLPTLLGHSAVGPEVGELEPNLFAINICPDAALQEYARMKLRSDAAVKLVFGNDFMKRFLRMVPAIDEILLLGKTWHLESERSSEGRSRWDVIIVDSPATGHGVSILRLPELILSVVGEGPLASDARNMRALITDPERTAFHIVTLPEELPVEEAVELERSRVETLSVPAGLCVVNRVWPDGVPDSEWPAVEEALRGAEDLDGCANALEWMRTRQAGQSRLLERIRADLSVPVVVLPFVFSPSFGRPAIEMLANHLEAQLEVGE